MRGVYVCITVYFHLCMSCKLKALYFMICISYIVKPKTFFMSIFSGHWISLHNVFNASLLFYYMIHQHLFNHHVATIENLILFLFFGCISNVARKSLICKLLLLSVPIVTWSEKLLIRWLHLLRLLKKCGTFGHSIKLYQFMYLQCYGSISVFLQPLTTLAVTFFLSLTAW